ncbi:hypothetical protein SteCoe_39620 [Stentor coeruleus]|uniref:Uncharacterized protein n=1 Tax=Stentor coeruleus TaxID=5963 RepID=A0A1R2AKN0_9CILI|nr:hypothetical protein SteCoe_39620 [Stentor coeruleus]
MDFGCKYKDCFLKGFWECTCPRSLKFCDIHIMEHSKLKGCSNKYNQEIYENFINISRDYENVFRKARSDCINLSQIMISEILNYLNKQLYDLKNKKHLIEQSLSNGQDIFEFLNNLQIELNFLTRDRALFTNVFQKLLCINPSSIPIGIENLKCDDIKKELKKTREKLEETEDELRLLKIANEIENKQKKSEENNINSVSTMIDETREKLNLCTALNESQIREFKKDIENYYIEMRTIERQNKKLLLNIDELQKKIDLNETQSKKIRISKNLPHNEWKKKFNSFDQSQRANFLVQNDYQNFKSKVVDLGFRVKCVKLTNDGDYIFVCKIQADCKNY